VELVTYGREVVVIGAYAPTNDTASVGKDKFWDTLRDILEEIPRRKEIIITQLAYLMQCTVVQERPYSLPGVNPKYRMLTQNDTSKALHPQPHLTSNYLAKYTNLLNKTQTNSQ
jgi:hypothetical protein